MKYFLSTACLIIAMTLSSCSPIGAAVGAGATLGISAAREGGIKGTVSDLKIKTLIIDKWFKYDVETFTKLNLTVNQGRVLVTGIVQNPDHRVEAIRLVWTVEGVNQVINEVRVAEGEGLPGYIRDQWITTRLRTEMTFDREIQSINYSIDTVAGTVYLMGVAQDQAELNKVIETARTMSNVRQVISYVKLAGEELEDSAQDTSGYDDYQYEGQYKDPYAEQYNSGQYDQSNQYNQYDDPASYGGYNQGANVPVEVHTQDPQPVQLAPQYPYYEPIYAEPTRPESTPPPVESEQLLWPDK